jgi:hypothetical protein
MSKLTANSEAGTFLGSCIQLYEDMLAEIKVCKKERLQEEECIQVCFEIAATYKEKLNASVRIHVFANIDDEIFFFKNVKPLFQAEVEFYTYRYHIVLFKTKEMEGDQQELDSYYKRQLLRKDKFKREHPQFYDYVHNKETYADRQWFTRSVNNSDSSLFDALMGKWFALEKFEDYVKGMMCKGS